MTKRLNVDNLKWQTKSYRSAVHARSLLALLFYVDAEAEQKLIYFRLPRQDPDNYVNSKSTRTPHNGKLRTPCKSSLVTGHA
jgi:hypothetical protein